MISCIHLYINGFIIFLATTFAINNHWNSVFTRSDFWIKSINSNNSCTWKAGLNFHSNLQSNYIKALVGTLRFPENVLQSANHLKAEGFATGQNIPNSFDARNKWPACKSLSMIRDQGECGSCWAVAASSVFGDRLCIVSNGNINVMISGEEPLACCTTCGSGCDGGYVDEVWRFFQTNGVVSGGEYNSNEGCQPYSKMPCQHYINSTVNSSLKSCEKLDAMLTPLCNRKCTNQQYEIPFSDDHRKANKAYILPPIEKLIQLELFSNGPLQAVYEVYEDFLFYKTGVYKRTESPNNSLLGLHSVKLIGWGTDRETPYWLVINSWNRNWGDDGIFKIVRGINNCNFEAAMIGGIPA